jgi:hypothetical protein
VQSELDVQPALIMSIAGTGSAPVLLVALLFSRKVLVRPAVLQVQCTAVQNML